MGLEHVYLTKKKKNLQINSCLKVNQGVMSSDIFVTLHSFYEKIDLIMLFSICQTLYNLD